LEVRLTFNLAIGIEVKLPGQRPILAILKISALVNYQELHSSAGERTVDRVFSAQCDQVAGSDYIRDRPHLAKSRAISLTIISLSVRELPGNHRYQADAASRPQYIEDGTRSYLLYDGSDDFFETNAVDFTGTDKMTVWWGGRKLSDAARELLLNYPKTLDTHNGSFNI
jgi:hypothetical protein